jgi:UDP-N-acetylglucosamine 2-epimerase
MDLHWPKPLKECLVEKTNPDLIVVHGDRVETLAVPL